MFFFLFFFFFWFSTVAGEAETGRVAAGRIIVFKMPGKVSVVPKLAEGVFVVQEEASVLALKAVWSQACNSSHLLQKARKTPVLEGADARKMSYVLVENCDGIGFRQYALEISNVNDLDSAVVFYISVASTVVFLLLVMGYTLRVVLAFDFRNKRTITFCGVLLSCFFSSVVQIVALSNLGWIVGVLSALVYGFLAFLLLMFYKLDEKRSVGFGVVTTTVWLAMFVSSSNRFLPMQVFLSSLIAWVLLELYVLYLLLHLQGQRYYFLVLAALTVLSFLLVFDWVIFLNPHAESLLIWLSTKVFADLKLALILGYLAYVL